MATSLCKLCGKTAPPPDASGEIPEVCEPCRQEHALQRPSPPMRAMAPCTHCGHTQFVRCRPLRQRINNGDSMYKVAPLAATYQLIVEMSGWDARQVRQVKEDRPLGVLEAYVCRQCGFTELYARNAATIPIGVEFGTELIDVGTGSPYR
jgi:predicted nucleic-acid-binding Zn-ribbon protein